MLQCSTQFGRFSTHPVGSPPNPVGAQPISGRCSTHLTHTLSSSLLVRTVSTRLPASRPCTLMAPHFAATSEVNARFLRLSQCWVKEGGRGDQTRNQCSPPGALYEVRPPGGSPMRAFFFPHFFFLLFSSLGGCFTHAVL